MMRAPRWWLRQATALLSNTTARLRKPINQLRGGVEASADDQGWALLGALGKQIANRDWLDPPNHGYRKLVVLVSASGLFEVRRQALAVYVRDRRHPQERGGRTPQ